MFIHPVHFIILLSVLLIATLGHLAHVRSRARKTIPVVGSGEQELRKIKDRVQVLERIATDKESSLSREIDDLRDR